jgi:hypothetical protein
MTSMLRLYTSLFMGLFYLQVPPQIPGAAVFNICFVIGICIGFIALLVIRASLILAGLGKLVHVELYALGPISVALITFNLLYFYRRFNRASAEFAITTHVPPEYITSRRWAFWFLVFSMMCFFSWTYLNMSPFRG